jgi:hypothetical protein
MSERHQHRRGAIDEWWGKVGIGGVIVAGATFLYSQFIAIEEGTRQSARINAALNLLYQIGGKWTASGLLGLFGLAIAAWGVVQLVRGRE